MGSIVRQRRTPPDGYGRVLAAARSRAGLGLREVARRVGLDPSYLSKLEAGTRCPSLTVARSLADVYGLDGPERHRVLAGAVDDAGRDHPGRQKSAA